MVSRDKLVEYINGVFGEDLLAKAEKKDELANGIQFLGKKEVRKIAFGVSLNEEFLKKAIKWGAQFCVFHHGFDPRTYKSSYSLSTQKRLRLIIKNELTIMAFHYGLDAHPYIGNNAVIIEKLGADIDEPFFDEWGYFGTFTEPKSVEKLKSECERIFDHEILAIYSNKKKIRKIGVCSGAAKPYVENISEMEKKGVELFISGETSESKPHAMLENEIAYFVCGHYATEVFGIKNLAEDVKKEFNGQLEVKFIYIKNPI
ncbi:Nif3-like dinuclear metal center hexameric protein [Candidatus Woesebacteria bacterium]|nr:Nif3-like dinuclear metal center hexameric protein [Candidatus Woesebacteria bacterium]